MTTTDPTTDQPTLARRTLGAGDHALEVSALGLGCMGMSEFYGSTDESTGVTTIHRALDLGVSFLDTADMYGPFTNEQLVGKANNGRRDDVQLATKFGNKRGPNGERGGGSESALRDRHVPTQRHQGHSKSSGPLVAQSKAGRSSS